MQQLFLLLALAGFVCTTCEPAEQTGIIGGVVRNGWTKTSIKRAIVTLRTTGQNILEALAYSEANGAFAFTGVPPGDYTLCARLTGYERACFGGNDELGTPVQLLTLAPGQRKQDVVLAMLPNGSVSGTVLDADGDPVPHAHIQLLRPVYTRRTLHWQPAGQAVANEAGEYHLPFVQPGDYRVMASAQYQQALRVRPEAVVGQPVQEEIYLPQFYPGATSVDGAASLTLNAGNDLKGIDFTLSTTPQIAVAGTIHPPQGVELDGFVQIQFLPENRAGWQQDLRFGTNAPDFTFQANVAPGRYRLIATAEAKDRPYRADQWVDASSSNISVALTPGTPLTGKLIIEGESRNQHGPYSIHLTSGDDSPVDGAPPATEVSENGAFEFPSIFPGVWDIGVTPMPPGSYIKSMLLGDQDVLTKDMKLEEGVRKPLTIVLSTKGAVVSGNVMMKDGTGPVTNVRSRLLLAPAGTYEDVLGFYKTTLTDSKGHFEFKGITPGNYRIYAFDRLQLDEYWKPDFLKPFLLSASDPFPITEGARVSHDANLIIRNTGAAE